MSAKRARKPLSVCDPNVNRAAKRAKTVSSPAYDPATFCPMQYIEHAMVPRMLPDIRLAPAAIFGLFWNDEIIGKLVQATNAYAQQKKATKQQWLHPATAIELRRFLGITILMGITRLRRVSRYWSQGLLSAQSSLSYYRYCQIKRFIHISMPQDTAGLSRKDWWKKLEPLSSHLRQQSQTFALPATNISIDEMMVPFTGRSFHTVHIPSKPIPVGYKVIALCSSGYTVDWMLTSRTESFAELEKIPELSPTSSAVLQLCRSLDTKQYSYVVYTDNGFSTIPLFRALRERGIGACGTTQANRAEYPLALENTSLTEWNSIDGYTMGPTPNEVLCFRWMDNNIVRMLTTVHPWNEVTQSLRRKPRKTSTNAAIVRRAFGDNNRAAFFIPTAIDDYNHHMGGVDIADQRRAGNTLKTFTNSRISLIN